tara:strand:+ start:1851 stop:2492 length:642 start_codon:yes stop_codon:yes gene_type:complete
MATQVKESIGYRTTDGLIYKSENEALSNQNTIDNNVKYNVKNSFYEPFLHNLSLLYPKDFSVFYNKTATPSDSVNLKTLLSKYATQLSYCSKQLNDLILPTESRCFAPITYTITSESGDIDVNGLKINSTSLGNQLITISDTVRIKWFTLPPKRGVKGAGTWACMVQKLSDVKGTLIWWNIFQLNEVLVSGEGFTPLAIDSGDTFALTFDPLT